MSRHALRLIQTGCDEIGHDPGPIDGFWGRRTRSALEGLIRADGRAPETARIKLPTTTQMIHQGRARHPVREIILHASATRPGWMAAAPLEAQVAEIRRWHMVDRGWRDIGYHWVIGRGGTLMPGRAMTEIGAHVVGRNQGTIGLCLIGGHGASEGDPFGANFTAAQDQALRAQIRAISHRTQVDRISGHNEFAAKACPGFHVPSWANPL